MYDCSSEREVLQMLELFQLGDFQDECRGLLPLVKIIRRGVFPIVQIGIPLLLIIFGTIDLGKAVISSDDKEVKASQSRLIKRCIYAVAIFFVVTLVTLLMSIVSDSTSDEEDIETGDWRSCWNAAK